ncbi:T9SS type A sorting domain-containing protein [Flavobacterium sp. J372]|uniref:Ig-like domain-containing protein n=1 Tax=Flavobacterium sp. J372 TaxID=2898436 RepID=UPI002150BEE2|nr:choice-of-anchor Q domain-containing protein [Flavobacterium sp. J372]MCR5862033.1 T9SS type A sorting domain-containing protein [Flavobacterium sp. J372]
MNHLYFIRPGKLARTFFLLCLAIFCLGTASAQTIRYVKPVASGNGSGTSWGNASNNLQAMITASAAGDQVWVAAGTYKPGTASSARTVTFTLKSGVKVYGSFAGNETSVNQRNIAANPTTLSGDLNGNDVPSNNPMLMSSNTTMSTNAYHVVTASGLNSSSVFDGFTITGGYANGLEGSYINEGRGGGLYVSASAGTFSNLIIKNCYAFNGGGILVALGDGTPPRFIGILISECAAGENGANDGSAVYKATNYGSPDFFNMVVTNCAGSTAVDAEGANIINSTFYNIFTGDIYNSPYNAVVEGANMYNCIIGQHSLPYAVRLIYDRNLENNSFYGVVSEASNTWYRKENITNNGDAGFVDAANGNFRLAADSPCINTGDPENLFLFSSISRGYSPATTDIAGNARQIGTVDRGAYEFGQTSIKYVKQISSGTGDGSSWENASSDLQLMINQAGAGDQIWVAKGIYKPIRQANSAAITPNNRDNTFLLKTGVKIYGSFAGGETTTAGRNFQSNATILSGDFMNNDPDNTTNALAIAGSSLLNDNAYHIVVGVNIEDVILDGFVLKGGVANGTGSISFPNGNFSPFEVSRDFGGGMHLNRVQGQFNNIAIRSSLATSGGGGIFNSSVSNLLTRFNGLIVTGCLGGTTGAGKGSAIYVKGTQDSTVDFFNTLVTNCVGSSSVFVTSTKATAYFSNATFYGVSVNDAAATTASVIETASGGAVVFNNSIIGLHAYPFAFNIGWASNIGSASANSSIYKTKTGQGTFTATNNTTNTGNPGFINASAGDFGLTSSSAVRNLGNVAFLSSAVATQYQYPAISKDIIGNPRTFQGNLDLGAYQYKQPCDIPDAPLAGDITLCTGSTVANLTAVGTNLKWYLNQTGGSPLSSSTALSTRGYFVSQSIGVCESERIEVNVKIIALPAAPSIGSQLFCGPSTVANLIALNPNLKWYATSTGGTALSPSTALTHNTNYYASAVNADGCEGSRTSVTVRIGTIPPAPASPSVQMFCGTAKVSDLQATGNSIRWYNTPAGGSSLSANTALGTGIYYCTQFVGSCESPRTAVEVVVTTIPAAPAALAQSFCGSAIVDNLVASGENHTWYDSSFNTLSGNTILGNGTYYVTQTVNGCPSAATAVNVSVLSLPTMPAVYDQTYCYGATVAGLSAAGTSIKWYTSTAGGTALASNYILTSGTYYASQTNAAGCESARAAAHITIMPLPPAPGAAKMQTFCGEATFADLESDAPETKWYATITGGQSIPQTTPLSNGTYYGAQMNFDCESERTAVQVIVSPIPAAPTASSQTFCGTATVADLSATGTNLKWYADAISAELLSPNAVITTGTYYVSASNDICESDRTSVQVTVTTLPEAPVASAQTFCENATVSDLAATGNNLKWYNTEYGGNELSSDTQLTTGSYYVSQSNDICESTRIAVAVTVQAVPAAPTASSQTFCETATVAELSATGINLKWYADAAGGDALASDTALATGIYYVSSSNDICESDRTSVQVTVNTLPEAPTASAQSFCGTPTVSGLAATGTNLKWYASATGGEELSSNTFLSTGTYYVSQSNDMCESIRTAVAVNVEAIPSVPTASSQTFCGTATVADLSATGTNLKWYAHAIGGNVLVSGEALSTGIYYVSSSNDICESDRTSVQVTVTTLPEAPVASAQTFCGNATVNDLIATGINLKWYRTETGGEELSGEAAIVTGTYYVSQSNDICESTRTAVAIIVEAIPAAPTASSQTLCGTATVADLSATGTNLKWYADAMDGDVLATNHVISTGIYYVSSANGNCESDRTAVSIIVEELPVKPSAPAQAFCGEAVVSELVASGSNIKWYTAAVGGEPLSAGTPVATGTYYVSQSSANCESLRTPVEVTINPIPAAPVADNQAFCSNPAVNSIVAEGENLRWYSFETGGDVLEASTLLNAGIYYVSQTINGCESPRTAVEITIAEILPAPVAYNQSLCTSTTVADLVAEGINLKWYTEATGGSALSTSQPLASGVYYVSQTGGICESPRNAVAVTLYACSAIEESYCNTTRSFAAPIYAKYVRGATIYRFRVTSAAGTEILDRTVRYFAFNNLASYTYNTTYTIEVAVFNNGIWSPYGPACNINTPALQTSNILPQYCGTEVSFIANIYAEGIQSATAYRFRISDNGAIQYIEKPMRYFTVNEIAGYTYGKSYLIDVAVMVNGQWGAYGAQCNVLTIPLPTSQLAPGYCGGTMPTTKTVIYANGISQAMRYRFRIQSDGNIYILENTQRYFMPTSIPGNGYGKTYTVEVAVQIGGQWGDYGNACTVSMPNAPTNRPGSETSKGLPEVKQAVSITSYPNPYTETFAIAIETQSDENVTVRTFDMNGRSLENITTSPAELSSVKLGAAYQEGVYNVIVTQGSYQKTFKVVRK